LDIEKGELFTILGHNGAGKTTLINILTGNISSTSGSAKINGYDILNETGKIEEYIGLCPQHDILWEELTAREHILLYSKIRSKISNNSRYS
jgi:ATP-binding cassette subfamily A (ABC1) protein 3